MKFKSSYTFTGQTDYHALVGNAARALNECMSNFREPDGDVDPARLIEFNEANVVTVTFEIEPPESDQ